MARTTGTEIFIFALGVKREEGGGEEGIYMRYSFDLLNLVWNFQNNTVRLPVMLTSIICDRT